VLAADEVMEPRKRVKLDAVNLPVGEGPVYHSGGLV